MAFIPFTKEFKSKAITAKETKEKLGNDTFRFLKGFAEATGREINFFSLPNSKVNGTYHNGVIHINIDAEKMWVEALNASVGVEGAVDESGARFKIKSGKEQKHIKDAIRNARSELAKMNPVVSVNNAPDLMDKSFAERQKIFERDLKKYGTAIDRQGFGTIEFNGKLMRAAFDYLNTYEEYAAFYAIPRVLKRGVIIDEHGGSKGNRGGHKDRGYDTFTIAALILLDGERADVGVVVRRTKGYRYDMHRVLFPDKTLFDLDKMKTEGTNSSMTDAVGKGEGLPISSVNNTVPNSVPKVNGQKSIAENEEFVRLSPQRMDSLISEYAIPGNTKSDYSKAWIATINPRDFLKLTVRDDVLDTWEVGTKNEWGQEVRELDKEDLKNTRLMPFLKIDTSDSHSVIGHEGRHRMLALYRAGYTEVPVVIQDINEATKNNKKPMEEGEGTDLWSQDFGSGAINDEASVEVYDTIPINEKNRAEIERIYGAENEEQVQFSISPEQQEILNDKGVNITESGTVAKFSLTSWIHPWIRDSELRLARKINTFEIPSGQQSFLS